MMNTVKYTDPQIYLYKFAVEKVLTMSAEPEPEPEGRYAAEAAAGYATGTHGKQQITTFKNIFGF